MAAPKGASRSWTGGHIFEEGMKASGEREGQCYDVSYQKSRNLKDGNL